MRKLRKIILIDEDKCSGCGQCILACAEGALQLVNGKAKLVSEVYCDGLGVCLGECPEGALTVIEREAEDFDEKAVEKHLDKDQPEAAKTHAPAAKAAPASDTLPCGCPSNQTMVLTRKKSAAGQEPAGEIASELSHWPIKLKLLRPEAPFLKGADLLLLADCAGVSYPDLHRKLLSGKAVALACPKFDDLDEHIAKLADIIRVAKPRRVTVVHMEVPCCRGLVHAAEKAVALSQTRTPLTRLMIGRAGDILETEEMNEAGCDCLSCAAL